VEHVIPTVGGAGQDPAAAARASRPVARAPRPLGWGWGWLLAGGAAVLIAVRAPAVAGDVGGVLAHGLRWPWLAAVAGSGIAVLAAGIVAQRQLLAAAGARVPRRAVAAVVFASAGLARVLPVGPAAAAAWQAGQYRRRGAGRAAGVWAVLAGGFASMIAVGAVLVAGAVIAGTGRWWLVSAAAAPAAGGAVILAAVCRAGAAARWLARRGGRSAWGRRLVAGLAGLARHRVGPRRGVTVLAASGLSVLAEAGMLAAAFGVAGAPVPWRGLLLACAAGQLGGRLVPLPGGLGGMEGGLLGALALTGTRPAAAAAAVLIYRAAGYGALGAAGAITAAALTRARPAPAAPRPLASLKTPAFPPGACPDIGEDPHSPGQVAPAAPAQRILFAARPAEGDSHAGAPW
jgi:putative heme transporter